MNRLSPCLGLNVPRWLPFARIVGAAAALVAVAFVGRAQQSAISTIAGAALTNGSTDTTTGPATLARFYNPHGVAVDAAGNLYIADSSNGSVRMIATSGAVKTLTTGLLNPSGIAVDGQTPVNVYVTDTGHQIVIKLSGATLQTVTTIAGNSGSIGLVDNAVGTSARFFNPNGIAVNAAGTVAYVADTNNSVIRRIDLTGTNQVSTVAGTVTSGAGVSGALDGNPGSAAKFNAPYGVALNSTGTTLYVADYNNSAIRSVDVSGGTPTYQVLTFAGTMGSAGFSDSPSALFRSPSGVAVDSSGNVYVIDNASNTLRKITSGGTVSTLAGSDRSSGISDGLGTSARFNSPYGVAVTSNGNSVYVADSSNQTVRLAAAGSAPTITTQPTSGGSSISVASGGTLTLTVVATGSPAPTYQWRKGGVPIPGASSATYTNNAVTTGDAGVYDVVVSNGVGSSATSSAVTVTVTQVPQITNTTVDYTTSVGQTGTLFTVTATGTPTPTFSVTGGNFPTWASINNTTGVVSVSNVNNPVPSADTGVRYSFTVTATSSGVATVATKTFSLTVQNAPTITSQPADRNVTAGTAATFSVTAAGTPAPTSFTWQRQIGGTGGFITISSDSTYSISSGTNSSSLTISSPTTGMNGDRFQVVVDNGIGTTTSTSALLTVSIPPVFVAPYSTTFVVGQTGAFRVQAGGTPAATYSVVGGNFPTWASLANDTGLITTNGVVPTDAGGLTYNFTVQASNGSSVQQQYSIVVSTTPLTPTVTTQPLGQTVALGQNATFTVAASGSPTLTYQWQRYRTGDTDYVNLSDGGQYSGTATATMTITGVTAEMDGDLYRVVVTNSLGNTTSSTAQLSITSGTLWTTLAGQAGVAGTSNGTGSSAHFRAPGAVVVDSSGTLYVADTANHAIRKVTADGVATTLAGLPGTSGSADGVGSDARFNSPSGLAIDSAGNIYVADSGNQTIRVVSSTGLVRTVAGSAGLMGYAEGTGTDARFAYPSGVAVDNQGNLFVADLLNNKIRKLIPAGALFTSQVFPLVDGGGGTTFSYPNAIVADSSNNLYVADTRNNVIRKITPGGLVTVLAGTVGATGSADGSGATARFNQPQGLAVDTGGNVYVADTYNDLIRLVTPSGAVTTFAGKAGVAGSADGDAGSVRFNQPYGVAVTSNGTVYVADTFNNTIRGNGAGAAPQITTDPQAASVRSGQNATFTVVASGSPTPSYQWQRQAAGASGFVNLNNDSTYSGVNSATLTVSSVTDAMNGDQFQVVVSNLISPSATSAVATLTVLPPIVVPVITAQPVATVVNQGDTATLSVTATSGTTMTYQWYKDGAAISGATSSTLTVPNSNVGNSGIYFVVVSNGSGYSTSDHVTISVNTVPTFLASPHDQVALAGTPVTFAASATGGSITYQWRRNGTAIPGANGSSYTIPSAGASDVAAYDVVASNSLGSVTSSLAQLSLASGVTPPVITAQPKSQIAVAGSTLTLSVDATGVPAPTYQWRKNGTALSGETNPTLTLSGVQGDASANYDVVVSNSVTSVTSLSANVHVIGRSYAGIYFGAFGNGLGSFAIYVRPDNTGVFLGYIPTSTSPVMTLNLAVDDSGNFTFTQSATAATASVSSGEPARAAALGSVTVSGTISADGSVTGSVSGGAATTLAASRSADAGSTQNVAGFYQAGARAGGGTLLTIANATGQSYVFAQVGGVTDGGSGTVSSNGNVAVNTGRSAITESITPATGLVDGASAGVVNGAFTGANDAAVSLQRLANISTRAQVGTGSNIEIAGFVITGTESKPVLIRAVGPTLANYGLSGVLANPKLDLYRSVGGVSTLIATNTGVNTSGNLAAITAAGKRAGAFDLGSSGADSAILITLAPGTYTAQVSGGTGIALVEVYDVSAPANGQKLINISTRAFASSDVNTLIAGVVVTGSAPKRVLIRAIGPGLTTYGLTGALAQPVLTLKSNSGDTVATNTGWNTSGDAGTLPAACSSVGAFPLTSGDSAMIVTLPPGSYTAQVTGSGTSSGTALVEIYELP